MGIDLHAPTRFGALAIVLIVVALVRPEAGLAEESGKTKPLNVPGLTVIGSPERAFEMPGSATVLDEGDIRDQSYADVNRVLRRVPGVYVREEDGFGLFPNISLRGVDTTRSSKVTVMEDGVLTAPAPYSAPAAYYSPNIARMSSVEVLKGSSQIRFGPHITGGVINYLSTPIPTETTAYVRTLYGQRNEVRVHAFGGDTLEGDWGSLGFLLEGFYRRSDGFKKIDLTPDFRSGDRTGFSLGEPMLKLAYEPPSDVYQRFEAKVGYSDIDADETYLGLNDEDFHDDPDRRYAASRFDNIQTEHLRSYLRHTIAPTDVMSLTTTIYYNEFRRNWFKLNDIAVPDGEGGSRNVDLSQAVAGIDDGGPLAVLKGEAAGVLRLRNNDRSYYLYGAETVFDYSLDAGPTEHDIAAGLRFHSDRERRFQTDERFQQESDGTISAHTVGTPGAGGNRREETNATALFVQDTISIGALSIIPGIRWEHLWLDSEDFGADPPFKGERELDLLAGGIGATYDIDPDWMLFGGVHRGFSPPDPRAATRERLTPETSIGTELGARHTNESVAFTAEATGFYTRFEDLIVIQNVGGTGTGESENVGAVDTTGVELAAAYDPGIANGWGFGNPYFANFTYTYAVLANDSNSQDPESIFAGGEKGNRVPYIPEFAFNLGTSIEFERVSLGLSGSYIDSVFATASNTSQQRDPEGNPDVRFGKTGSAFLLDVSTRFQLMEQVALLAGVQNAFDKRYVASRHPHGARPGSPIFGYGGVEVSF